MPDYNPKPTSRVFFAIKAMREDPTRVWRAGELAIAMDCPVNKVTGTLMHAIEHGAVFRVKSGKSTGYCLQMVEGALPPKNAPRPDRRRGAAKPDGHWEPSPDEIRIPRVVPGWMPPKMVAPREAR